jgi:RNA polymerase sigma factor (sigma-70 family)
MRDDASIEKAMAAHGDVVWRACLMRMGSHADAEDAFQETFLKYALHDEIAFESVEHERAWLLRVATNQCLDVLRSAAHATQSLDENPCDQAAPLELSADPSENLWEVAQALGRLPGDQRQAIYLTVCEGYSATEVAKMMDVPVNTVYSWVSRGKEKLRKVLG